MHAWQAIFGWQQLAYCSQLIKIDSSQDMLNLSSVQTVCTTLADETQLGVRGQPVRMSRSGTSNMRSAHSKEVLRTFGNKAQKQKQRTLCVQFIHPLSFEGCAKGL